ncbi:MAG: STE/STE20/YSK protein kinase [Amphiamblys sp. WSBS2006]|nr:MAG: STE/STE20/YSK protein kinase [Amphiamblys sp. WSBS2006]
MDETPEALQNGEKTRPGASDEPEDRRESYELKKEIGYGSSAIVYYAREKKTSNFLSIKIIDLDLYSHTHIPGLGSEIKLMKECRHPNLLPVYESFVAGSDLWVVTPYYSHGSVFDVLRYGFCDGFRDKHVVASVMLPVLHGLDYLHKKGHIHRDVKAANILLDERGGVCLGDFGVSYCLDKMEGEKKNIRKTFVGTPSWMAPEVMEVVRGYTSKADIWSFGITLVELALGRTPYANLPPMHVVSLVLTRPKRVDELGIPAIFGKSFLDLVALCLERDPSKRPSAEALLKHRFFRHTRGPEHLVKSIVRLIPPVHKRLEILSTESLADVFVEGEGMVKQERPCSSRFIVGDSGCEKDPGESLECSQSDLDLDPKEAESTGETKKGRFHLIPESEKLQDESETSRGRFKIVPDVSKEGPPESAEEARGVSTEDGAREEETITGVEKKLSSLLLRYTRKVKNKDRIRRAKSYTPRLHGPRAVSDDGVCDYNDGDVWFPIRSTTRASQLGEKEELKWIVTQRTKIKNILMINEMQRKAILELEEELRQKEEGLWHRRHDGADRASEKF